MTDEEKAIFSLEKWIEVAENGELDKYNIIEEDIEHLRTILDIIKNQQKEIEQLKNSIAVANRLEKKIKENFIAKSKIKEKINEYDGLKIMDETAWEEQVKPLEELLG